MTPFCKLRLVAAFSALVAFSAVAGQNPVVFVSIPPQAWLVKRLADGTIDVQTLLAPGANPHTFEPTARQVRALAGATLYLSVGMPFERTLAARLVAVNPTLRVAGVDVGIDKSRACGHEHGGAHGCADEDFDPHVWLSPRRFAAMASNTVAVLSQALPERRGALERNLTRTVGEIGAADRAAREAARTARIRTWVTYHPSWSYFAADYGLTLLIIEEEGKVPSARHLADVIGQARRAGVRVVFAEPQHDVRPARTLADQLGARLVCLDPLQEDWPALMRAATETLAER